MIRKGWLDRSSSTVTVAALVLVLALLVAAASVNASARSLLLGGHADRLRILVDLLPLFLLGAILAVVYSLVLHHRGGERRGAVPFETALARALTPVAAGVVIVCLLLLAHFDVVPPGDDGGTRTLVETEQSPLSVWSMSDWFKGLVLAGEGTGDPDGPVDMGSVGGGRISFFHVLMGLAVGLLVGAILGLRLRRRRTRAQDQREDEDHEAARNRARGALAETIRAMLADADPNTAIRGAYARLLQGLDERGRGRLDHEGPMEHLHRVLTTLRVRPAPLRELIGLFELARFSPHAVDEAERDRALLALRAVAADLEVAPGDGP